MNYKMMCKAIMSSIVMFSCLFMSSCGDSDQKILNKVFIANKDNCAAIYNPLLGFPSYTVGGPFGFGGMYEKNDGSPLGGSYDLNTNPLANYLNSFRKEQTQAVIAKFKAEDQQEFTLKQYTFIEECKLLGSNSPEHKKLSAKERAKQAQHNALTNIAKVQESYQAELQRQEQEKLAQEQQP